MELNYKKNNNQVLFNNFLDKELLNLENPQNYIPIYNNFFSLNDKNYNSINLNNKYSLVEIKKKISENKYLCIVLDENKNLKEIESFFKLSPLLDTVKYLAGKYDINDNNLYNLPKINNNENVNEKFVDKNNASYVDGFFYFLSSKLLNTYNFPHGLDYYGSFLGIKHDYHVNICDDIEFLEEKDFFYKNLNESFNFINPEYEDMINCDSRKNKKKLNFAQEEDIEMEIEFDEIIESADDKMDNNIELLSNINLITDANNLLIDDNDNDMMDNDAMNDNSHLSKKSKSTNSTCSSRSSVTDMGESDSDNDNNITNITNDDDYDDHDMNSDIDSDIESSSSEDIDEIMIKIKRFPIQVIALEQCENTFDSLLMDGDIKDDELGSIIVQILMILITYQKLFSLTHNDLHTNNIMYVHTDKKYIYYKFNDKHYKIPTYGKIFKIIDFGRAIYKFNDKIICSDSFHKDGDAATQYNCEPYYDHSKTKIEPNYSFDLCRLGCSMLDFINEIYDEENINCKKKRRNISSIHKIIMNWCNDDKGQNILYKSDGEERYPDFKLYKMIARKVHTHEPGKELQNKYFNKFICSKKEINKSAKIFNIDTISI